MRFKCPYEYGDILYLKNDPDQTPHEVVGFIFRPGDQLILELSYLGQIVEVYPFQTSGEIDKILAMGIKKPDEDEES